MRDEPAAFVLCVQPHTLQIVNSENCEHCLLHWSEMNWALSSQLPVVRSAAGETSCSHAPAHTAAEAGTDERQDKDEEDSYHHNSYNHSDGQRSTWLIT